MLDKEIKAFIGLLHQTDDFEKKIDKLFARANSVPVTHDELMELIQISGNKPLYETRKVNLMLFSGHITKVKIYVDPNKKNFFV